LRWDAWQVEHIQLELCDGAWDTMEQPPSPSNPEDDVTDVDGDQAEEPTPTEEEAAETAAEPDAEEENVAEVAEVVEGEDAGPPSATAGGEVAQRETVPSGGTARKQGRSGERKQRRRSVAATAESPQRKGSRSRRRADAPGTA